jgi:hypothetical protein
VVEAESVSVVGDFNDWSRDADLMDRDDDGFVAQLALQRGRAYRFRYLLDGERWENDWSADAYVPNEFGGDDSVVDLTHSASEGLPTEELVDDVQTTAEEAASPAPARKKAAARVKKAASRATKTKG